MTHPAVHTLKEVADRLDIAVRMVRLAKTPEAQREAQIYLGGMALGIHSYVIAELKAMGETPPGDPTSAAADADDEDTRG